MRFTFCIEQNVPRFDVRCRMLCSWAYCTVRANLTINSTADRIGIGSRSPRGESCRRGDQTDHRIELAASTRPMLK